MALDRGDAEGRWPAAEGAAELVHVGRAAVARRVRLTREMPGDRLPGQRERLRALLVDTPGSKPDQCVLYGATSASDGFSATISTSATIEASDATRVERAVLAEFGDVLFWCYGACDVRPP